MGKEIKFNISNTSVNFKENVKYAIQTLCSYIDLKPVFTESGSDIFYFNSKNELNKNSGNLLNIPFNEKLYSVFSYNEEVNDIVKSLNKNEYAGLIDNK
nr:hypothetical protein [Candidatus Dependentiae bacterium]